MNGKEVRQRGAKGKGATRNGAAREIERGVRAQGRKSKRESNKPTTAIHKKRIA
jgi:hypothetical protein